MSTEKTGKNTRGNRKPTQISAHTVPVDKSNKGLLERSKYSLDLVNGWIATADSKISTSCGIVSVAVAVLVFVAENILSKVSTANGIIDPWKTRFLIAVVLTTIAFLLSLFFHILALNPSFFSGKGKSNDNKKKKCNIFFEDIKEYKDAEEYICSVRKMSEDQFIDDILRETYANSDICSKKMHRLKIGVWCAFATIVLIFVCVFCYFKMYQY